MAIKQITREALRTLNADIAIALAAIGKAHGVSISTGGMRFDSTTATTKLTVSVIGEGVAAGADPAVVKAINDWKKEGALLSLRYNLEQDWLGKEFQFKGEPIKILGLMPNRRKFPVLVVQSSRSGGKPFLVEAHTVVMALGNEEQQKRARHSRYGLAA